MEMKHELPAWVADVLKGLSVERELPKWPVLTVVGENVSPELGREICVRTTWTSRIVAPLSSSEAWMVSVNEAFGIEGADEWGYLNQSEEDRVVHELGLLPLDYLGNDRVNANRFEVPSGWCDWDGSIGTEGTHLDAKWPTLKHLNEELSLIASTWPELTMTVQLSSYKSAETFDEYYPFLTWDVAHGTAVLRREPGEALCPIELPGASVQKITEDITHGADVETLRRAVGEVKRKIRR